MKRRLFLFSILSLVLLSIFSLRPEQVSTPGKQRVAERRAALPEAGKMAELSGPGAGKEVRELQLPGLDHEALLEEARKKDQRTRRHTFATARPVSISPLSHGVWERRGEHEVWTMKLVSKGARSVNLGFDRYVMPEGGELVMRGEEERPVRFDASDNEEHGQLWGPILPGEQVSLEVSVPEGKRGELDLHLSSINHAFRGLTYHRPDQIATRIGDGRSEPCHIDVACGSQNHPIWGPVLDQFRDQVRSVGAYTIGGVETCSGALINNTANDGRPFFLTAVHCWRHNTNAASVVVYWNFENSYCRRPGSVDSGRDGDGPVNQFNTGAISRATDVDTDMWLLELDDPVRPEVKPFFAGWNRAPGNFTGVVGIHHPAVAEKRFSFASTSTIITVWPNYPVPQSHFYLQFEYGKITGGSSGSPLFDLNGDVIGFCTGGLVNSTCTNVGPNWYGRLNRAWAVKSGRSESLVSWLDPLRTGVTQLDGINLGERLQVTNQVVEEGDEVRELVIPIRLIKAAPGEASMAVSAPDQGDDFSLLTERVSFLPGQLESEIRLEILGDAEPEEDETFTLQFSELRGIYLDQDRIRVTLRNDDYLTPVITSSPVSTTSAQEEYRFQVRARNTPRFYRLEQAPEGMSIDPEGGLISWRSRDVGDFPVTVIAGNEAGETQQVLTLTVSASPLLCALDVERPEEIGVRNGRRKEEPGERPVSEPWVQTRGDGLEGGSALRSGIIGAGERSDLTLILPGPDVISFRWKVDSEPGFDFLTVMVNGQEVERLSGSLGWRQVVLELPHQTNEVTWSYSKDADGSEGEDAGYVDQLSLVSQTGQPHLLNEQELVLELGKPFAMDLRPAIPESTFRVSGLPQGLEVTDGNRITGTPVARGRRNVIVNTTSPERRTLRTTLRFVIIDDLLPSLDTDALTITQGGNAFWVTENRSFQTYDGEDAVRASGMQNNQVASFEAEVTGPNYVQFYWQTQSEKGRDLLTVSIDGVVQQVISGNTGWELVTLPIPGGLHLVKWEYAKDAEGTSLDDGAWVDRITLASERKPFLIVPGVNVRKQGEFFHLPIELLHGPAEMSFENLPAWLSWNAERGGLEGTPPASGFFNIKALASRGVKDDLTGRAEGEVSFWIQVVEGAVDFATALEVPGVSLHQPNDSRWQVVDGGSEPRVLVQGLRDRQSSKLVGLVQGPGRLTFEWAVSSEKDRDFLQLFLNGRFIQAISGSEPLQLVVLDLPPGLQEVSWVYSRDQDGIGGANEAELRQIQLSGYPEFLRSQGYGSFSDAGDDEDGDGYGLFAEFAFGGDPRDRSTPRGASIGAQNQEGLLPVEFTGRVDATGVAYRLEWSRELDDDSWRLVQGMERPPLTSEETGTYRFQADPLDEAKGFYRVEAIPEAIRAPRRKLR